MWNKKDDPTRCIVGVYQTWTNSPISYQCRRKWTVQREDKYYCKQHDPVQVKKRRDVTAAKWKVQHDKDLIAGCRRFLVVRACDDVPNELLKSGILRKLIDFVYKMNNEALISELEGDDNG